MSKRASGILLHPSSLPGKFGIGCIGKNAMDFIDYLADCGFSLWQTLPLGPTGYGDSPYAAVSAFAANPLLIDLEDLYGRYHFDPKFLELPDSVKKTESIDFGPLVEWKIPLLEKIADFFLNTGNDKTEFELFKKENKYWLEDYALFMSIKRFYDKKAQDEKVYGAASTWMHFWPDSLKKHEESALNKWKLEHKDELERSSAIQYFFYSQWKALKEYANQKGISIIGDIPIFVAADSSDLWANQELFQLDKDSVPSSCAGVPPDYFSKTGQLWGNPLYLWQAHLDSDFAWWKSRIKRILTLCDYVRIDHFRGFESFWQIPSTEKTAINGKWVKAPGKELFLALKKEFPDLPVLAEDLGEITKEVIDLRDNFNLPGMKILQFAFSAQEAESSGMNNPFLPHRYPEHCVCYTGTHDNDTSQGWLLSLSKSPEGIKTLSLVAQYLFGRNFGDKEIELMLQNGELAKKMIVSAISSPAFMSIIPMQDILFLDSSARMNMPSTTGKNWCWRMSGESFSDASSYLEQFISREELKNLNFIYGRS